MSRRRIAVLVGAVLFVGALVGLLVRHWERAQNRLTVENRSGQPLTVFKVITAGEAITFTDVPVGGEVTAAFGIQADDHFAVEGRLADGKRVGGDFGYVTNGMSGQRARFVVRPGGQIEFTQSSGINPYGLGPSSEHPLSLCVIASRAVR